MMNATENNADMLEIDDYYDYEPVEIEMDDALVLLEGPEKSSIICGVEVFYREGCWCERDEETEEFIPDWSLTWFYIGEGNCTNYVYFEQDPPETALHNFSYALNNNAELLQALKDRVVLHSLNVTYAVRDNEAENPDTQKSNNNNIMPFNNTAPHHDTLIAI